MATSRQKSKTHKVMSEYKHGNLKSGSGKKVKSRKQARWCMLAAECSVACGT